jgi:hypothetical protein
LAESKTAKPDERLLHTHDVPLALNEPEVHCQHRENKYDETTQVG